MPPAVDWRRMGCLQSPVASMICSGGACAGEDLAMALAVAAQRAVPGGAGAARALADHAGFLDPMVGI